MPDFLKHYFIRQYGLKSIALKNLANLAAGVRQEHATNTRLRLFGKLAGMLDPDDYHDSRVNMMMEGLRALFHTNEIHGHMEGHPSIAVTSLASATLAVFTSKYYFPDDDELLLVEGKPMLHPDMEEEIRELADPEDKPEQPSLQAPSLQLSTLDPDHWSCTRNLDLNA